MRGIASCGLGNELRLLVVNNNVPHEYAFPRAPHEISDLYPSHSF
jgi:hypothetical protein